MRRRPWVVRCVVFSHNLALAAWAIGYIVSVDLAYSANEGLFPKQLHFVECQLDLSPLRMAPEARKDIDIDRLQLPEAPSSIAAEMSLRTSRRQIVRASFVRRNRVRSIASMTSSPKATNARLKLRFVSSSPRPRLAESFSASHPRSLSGTSATAAYQTVRTTS